MQRIETLSNGTRFWDDSTRYPALHRPENQGLVTSSWCQASHQCRDKYYALTAKGKKALTQEKQQWLPVDAVLAQF